MPIAEIKTKTGKFVCHTEDIASVDYSRLGNNKLNLKVKLYRNLGEVNFKPSDFVETLEVICNRIEKIIRVKPIVDVQIAKDTFEFLEKGEKDDK